MATVRARKSFLRYKHPAKTRARSIAHETKAADKGDYAYDCAEAASSEAGLAEYTAGTRRTDSGTLCFKNVRRDQKSR